MSGSVFTTDEVLVDVGFDAARRRLGCLAGDGVLLGAAEYAYGTGITGLVQEAGPGAGMSRLAGVRPGDLTETVDCARLGLRWEAIGPDGNLYPALDANLTLTPSGATTTLLALTGVYRLADPAYARLDPAIVHCFAAVTIRSFIARLACALMHPAGAALRQCTQDKASAAVPPRRETP
jgi:hypothetical protein